MTKDSTPVTTTEIDLLETVLSKYHRDDAPGLIVSVQRHGKLLLRRGYGLASLESGQTNTPSTKMRIGSTTKNFACVMALLLREKGLLSIDEPVSQWLPELPASQGRRTLRQFMNHTGGTRDYLDLSMISNGMAFVPEDGAFEYQCRQQADNFAPGDAFIYNNGGYRMLSLVIERVTQLSLAEAMRQRLFEPLGMHNTSLWSNDLDPLPSAAQTHIAHADGRFTKGIFPSVLLGEGGIASTLDDMQRWLSHLMAPTLWPQAISDEMLAPTQLNNGYVNAYGLGLIAEQWRGTRLFHHGGGVVGGSCQMLCAPDHGIQIIVMTNRSDAAAPNLAEELLTALLKDELQPVPTPADPALANSLGGHFYGHDTGHHFEILNHGEKLFLKGLDGMLPLSQEEGVSTLRVNVHSVIVKSVNPVLDAQGTVVAIDVTDQGKVSRCERIVPLQERDSLSAFSGHWQSEELRACITIGDARPGTLQIAGHHGTHRLQLEPLLQGVCSIQSIDPAAPFSGMLRLSHEEDGRRRLTLDTGRTRGMTLHAAGPSH